MKHYLIVVLLLALASYSLGQTSSTPLKQSFSQEKPKIKDFGSSLRKFGKKKDTSKTEKGQAEINDEETIRIKTDLVVSDVLVVNQKGDAILGLEQSDFVITEDGVPQKISMFSFGENATIPRSIVLIIDYSNSQSPFIKNSIEAAKVLVDKLAPQDRMAIVTDDVKLLVGFTKDKALLKKELDKLGKKPFRQKFGRSEQYSALVATLNEMFDEEDIRPIVIFQTDGDELLSLKTDDKNLRPSCPDTPRKKSYSVEDVYALISKSRATIYSIIPGLRLIGVSQEEQFERIQSMSNETTKTGNEIWGIAVKQRKLSKDELRYSRWHQLQWQLGLLEIAKLSGGYADYIERSEDAENVYSNIFTVISNRYLMGYYPTNKERSLKRRNVKIEVRNHPECIITGRKAYVLE